MNDRLTWWMIGLFLLLFLVAVIDQVVIQLAAARRTTAQRTAAQVLRADAARRLPRVLQACEAAVRAEHGSSLRLALTAQDDWEVWRQPQGVAWTLNGTLLGTRSSGREVFSCEAAEEGETVQVTFTESPAWWTPPPSDGDAHLRTGQR